MKRMLFILLSCLAFGFQATAQTGLRGKWYMFSRNRVIQLTFSGDSLFSDQLDWDLRPMDPSRAGDTGLIVKRIPANHNEYLLLTHFGDTHRLIFLNTVLVISPSSEIALAVNSPDSGYTTIARAQHYIRADTGRKYGLSFFSESAIHTFQKQKSIESMTVADFKLYGARIITLHSQIDSLGKLPNAPSGLYYYGFSMLRTLLAKMGFDPFVSNDQLEKMFKRFDDDPETKELYHQIFH
jgi:hypothetical protein